MPLCYQVKAGNWTIVSKLILYYLIAGWVLGGGCILGWLGGGGRLAIESRVVAQPKWQATDEIIKAYHKGLIDP